MICEDSTSSEPGAARVAQSRQRTANDTFMDRRRRVHGALAAQLLVITGDEQTRIGLSTYGAPSVRWPSRPKIPTHTAQNQPQKPFESLKPFQHSALGVDE